MIFKRVLFIAAAAVGLTGCMSYPVHKITQPQSQVIVQDEGGGPIEGATVTLLTQFNPHPIEPTRQIKTTDATGTAAFPEVREWQFESLMIHGMRFYFWNWCVQKPGFKTYVTGGRDTKFEEKTEIKLVKGTSSACP